MASEQTPTNNDNKQQQQQLASKVPSDTAVVAAPAAALPLPTDHQKRCRKNSSHNNNNKSTTDNQIKKDNHDGDFLTIRLTFISITSDEGSGSSDDNTNGVPPPRGEEVEIALLDMLCPWGVIDSLHGGKKPVKDHGVLWEFSIQMNRKSETLRVVDKLHGTILKVGEHSALIKCTSHLPFVTKVLIRLVTKPQDSNMENIIKRQLRHRLSCCGTIVAIDVEDHLAWVTFASAWEAARALEDIADRCGITHLGGVVEEKSVPVAAAAAVPPVDKRSRSRTLSNTSLEHDLLATSSDGQPKQQQQLFVVHSKSVTREQVIELFSSCHGFESIDVKLCKRRNAVRGVSFVTFKNREDATTVLEKLHGTEFPPGSDCKLKVIFSEPHHAQQQQAAFVRGRSGSDTTATQSVRADSPATTSELKPPPKQHSPPRVSQVPARKKLAPSGVEKDVHQQSPIPKPKQRTATAAAATTIPPPVSQPAPLWYMSPYTVNQHHLMDAALAETFDNVVGFHDSQPQSQPNMYQQLQPSPSNEVMYHFPSSPYGYPQPPPQPYQPQYPPGWGYAPYFPPPPPSATYYSAPGPFVPANNNTNTTETFPNDVSRLHVTFNKPLPDERELNVAFSAAAPGLLYVSRHRGKSFAFVKYATPGAALTAMGKLHGAMLCGQRIRITLADPPPANVSVMPVERHRGSKDEDMEGRKRQRNVMGGGGGSGGKGIDDVDDDEEEDDDDADNPSPPSSITQQDHAEREDEGEENDD